MTRINLIPVKELSDQWLLAEHREIKRVPNCISKGKYDLRGVPDKYKMGAGHVKFFYGKLMWLFGRYSQLYKECMRRRFNVSCYAECFYSSEAEDNGLYNNWEPSEDEIEINKNRLIERYKSKPELYTWTKTVKPEWLEIQK